MTSEKFAWIRSCFNADGKFYSICNSFHVLGDSLAILMEVIHDRCLPNVLISKLLILITEYNGIIDGTNNRCIACWISPWSSSCSFVCSDSVSQINAESLNKEILHL